MLRRSVSFVDLCSLKRLEKVKGWKTNLYIFLSITKSTIRSRGLVLTTTKKTGGHDVITNPNFMALFFGEIPQNFTIDFSIKFDSPQIG